MALEIRDGPRGPAALWNGRQLASAYDAAREAERWADEQAAAEGSLVFVAGDPWGLAARALAGRGAVAVALLPGSAAKPHVPAGVTAWAPEDGELESFVRDRLDEWGPDAVVWLVWPAFERHAPELSLEWSRRFRDVYRTVQGSWLTQTRFGTRFWTNAVRNVLGWERPAVIVTGSRPVVIAASGPSLEDSLPAIAEHRRRFELWALPSSFEVLLRRGLVPDAAVATDGGYYAREHLQRLAGTKVPVLAALSSAPDPVLTQRPCLFFSQGMPVERQLLAALVSGYGEIPSQGTVAVTAIELALASTAGPVFVAGLDLAFRDLRGHASPHTADRRMETRQTRLAPREGLLAEGLFSQAPVTVDGVRVAPALLTYASWFRSRARFARPVYRVAPSALRWTTMPEVSVAQAAALWRSASGDAVGWSTPRSWPSRQLRRTAVERALNLLLERVEAGTDDAWMVEAARTGAPRALAEDLKAKRSGRDSGRVRAELAEFIRGLFP
jgi:hypothetical protein